jgi:hypothetical protein
VGDAGEMSDMGDAFEQRGPIGACRKIVHRRQLDPACGGDRGGIARGRPDLPPLSGESGGEAPADETGSAGHEHAPLHISGHWLER